MQLFKEHSPITQLFRTRAIIVFLALFSGLCISRWPQFVAAFLSGILIVLFLVNQSWTALVLVIAWQLASSPNSFDVTAESLARTAIGTAILACTLLACELVKTKRLSIPTLGQFQQTSLFISAFSAFSGISFLLGVTYNNNFRHIAGDLYNALAIPLFFFLPIIAIKRAPIARHIAIGIVGAIVIFSVKDILMFATGGFSIGAKVLGIGVPRLLTLTAVYSMLALPVTIALAVYDRTGRQSYWTLASIVICGALLATFTRSYWIGFLAGGAVIYLHLPARDKIRGALLVLPLALLFLLVGGRVFSQLGISLDIAQLIVARISNISDVSGQTRLDEIKSIVDLMKQNPMILLFGKGLGAEIYTVTRSLGNEQMKITHFIHNNYARVALQMGLIGLGLYLMSIFSYCRTALMTFRRLKSINNTGFQKGLLIGSVGTIVSMCIASLATNVFYLPFTYIIMGIACILTRFPQTETT